MTHVTRSCRTIGCLIAGLALAACSASGYSIRSLAPEINATLASGRATIEVGDTVETTFPFRAEWNHATRVRADGLATFPLIGEVAVAGKTVEELQKVMLDRYGKERDNEKIDLTIDVQAPTAAGVETSNAVFVIGDVTTPGPIPLTGRPLTLFEAIGAAGGHLKRTANLSNTVLVRRVKGTNEMRSWRLDADVYDWGSQPAIFLQARDIVFVPNTAIDDVNIWVDQWIRQMLPLPIVPIQ